MEENPKLCDPDTWKLRADYLEGLIREMHETIQRFFNEIANPLNDRMKLNEEGNKYRDESLKNIIEALKIVSQRLNRLEEAVFHEKPAAMLS